MSGYRDHYSDSRRYGPGPRDDHRDYNRGYSYRGDSYRAPVMREASYNRVPHRHGNLSRDRGGARYQSYSDNREAGEVGTALKRMDAVPPTEEKRSLWCIISNFESDALNTATAELEELAKAEDLARRRCLKAELEVDNLQRHCRVDQGRSLLTEEMLEELKYS